MILSASVLSSSPCYLGEGPMWHPARKSCFWTDIENRTLFEYKWHDQTLHSRRLDYKIALIIRDKDDHLILGLNGGLAKLNVETGALRWLLDIEKECPDHRCNDGGVDSEGRLWVGTMHKDFREGAGSLYCLDKGLVLEKKLENVTISNGLVWSGDNSRMYYIDSPTRTVKSFFFDSGSGSIQFEKEAIRIPENLGMPDGMTIDEEGMLWVAHWGGFGVYRWNPLNGEWIGTIKLPVPHVTSCAFAGERLDRLVITTARQDLSEEELDKYPASGDVFVASPGVKGVEARRCRF